MRVTEKLEEDPKCKVNVELSARSPIEFACTPTASKEPIVAFVQVRYNTDKAVTLRMQELPKYRSVSAGVSAKLFVPSSCRMRCSKLFQIAIRLWT